MEGLNFLVVAVSLLLIARVEKVDLHLAPFLLQDQPPLLATGRPEV